MATKYDWGDGKGRVHSISLAQHTQNMGGGSTATADTSTTDTSTAGPPVDPNLEAERAGNLRGLQLGDAWDTYATGQLQSEYGYDPSGNIDPSNPYSRAMHLQNSYQRGQADLTTGYQRGTADLSTGYGRNMQDAATGYGRNTEDLARQLGITQKSNLINMASAGQLNAGSLVNAQQFAQENANRTQGRLTQDYGTTTGRLTQDYGTTSGRMTEDYTTGQKRGSEDYGFASNDLKTQLSQALGGILQGKVQRYGSAGAGLDANTFNSIIKALGG
jgi:hypothetical protein